MSHTYWWSLTGLWFILLMVFLQNFIAAAVHSKKGKTPPGQVSNNLGHESLVFRTHRTFHNSLENLAVFVIPVIIGIIIGADPAVLGAMVWAFALARLGHMILYYAIATEKNPSPRSYFFLGGWLINAALYVFVGIRLFIG
ncbi:MAPEG family protein [Salinimonas marina]|uniref:MAPEG family protein n=1 Tax=Salinimonas marina TaxID=2785918 RepID=A0A7S9DY68_9ALTE|nr:MAPEG family protein [Salinimonas marina]QPG06053.1 MAPEG family protein [Salinimonas marina]